MMSEQVLFVTVIEYWGRKNFRPECDVSRRFAQLLGQKNLSEGDLEIIKTMGYKVKMKEVKL